MDKKNLQIGGLVATIVIALAVIVILVVKNSADGQGARTAEQSQVLDAIDRVGGDVTKLDPATKAKFDAMNANNPFSSASHYSQKPPAGTPAGYPAPPTGG